MKSIRLCLLVALSLLCSSCSKSTGPKFTDFTEEDLGRALKQDMTRAEVDQLFGEPAVQMETDEESYMLRFKRPDDRQQNSELKGVDIYFTKEHLVRWAPWKYSAP